jgi:predicted nucleic acid-binding protein
VRIVLDASAAVEVALNREKGHRLSTCLAEAREVLAPDCFISETVNAIWKYHQFENLDLDTCRRAIELAIGLVETFVPAIKLHHEAFLLARTTRRSAYDMFYLALARREDASLLTMDSALKKEAERQGIGTI